MNRHWKILGIVFGVILIDWGIKYLALPALDIDPIYNHRGLQYTVLGLSFLAGLLLLRFTSSAWILTAVGLLWGGLLANQLCYPVFGKVPDFIPWWEQHYYGNFADLCIVSSLFLIAIATFQFSNRQAQKSLRKPVFKTKSRLLTKRG